MGLHGYDGKSEPLAVSPRMAIFEPQDCWHDLLKDSITLAITILELDVYGFWKLQGSKTKTLRDDMDGHAIKGKGGVSTYLCKAGNKHYKGCTPIPEIRTRARSILPSTYLVLVPGKMLGSSPELRHRATATKQLQLHGDGMHWNLIPRLLFSRH